MERPWDKVIVNNGVEGGGLMDDMKESGIPWLGEIPAEWEIEKFKYNLKRSSDLKNGDVQVLSLYREFGIVPKDSRDDNHNVTSEDTSKYRMVRPGDFVVNKMKAWQGSVAVSNYKGIVSPAYYVFHFYNYHLDKKYFHFLMRSNYKDEFKRLSGGIREGQWDLPAYDLGNVKIILPPENEQQQIVTFLDEKCGEIDGIVAKIQQEVETLKQYKQSIISEAVTKGIRPNVSMKDSEIQWIGSIPIQWNVERLKFVTEKIGSGKTPKGGSNIYLDEGILFIRSQNVYDEGLYLEDVKYISNEINEEMNSTQLKKGDILFNITGGSLGRCCIYNLDDEGNVNQHVCIIRIKKEFYNVFFRYVLNSSISKVEVNINQMGGNRESITFEQLGNFKIPVPPLEEQREIAAYLDQKCAAIDGIISSKEEQLQTLSSYKKSLIYEYVTGKKRVPTA